MKVGHKNILRGDQGFMQDFSTGGGGGGSSISATVQPPTLHGGGGDYASIDLIGPVGSGGPSHHALRTKYVLIGH